MTEQSPYAFSPSDYEEELSAIVAACESSRALNDGELQGILRRHPKDGRGFFSKSEIIRGYRYLRAQRGLADDRGPADDEAAFLDKMRMKPIRTQSGVAPVTILTKPFSCPGRCIFCPSDVRMPKSYLSDEPGAQRAAEHQFDPYGQTMSRLRTYHNIGHRVDKVELLILGGTWSSYPEPYQRWFLMRSFEAMNDFESADLESWERPGDFAIDYRRMAERVQGGRGKSYNQIVESFQTGQRVAEGLEEASWEELEEVQRRNETALARCVGLVLETRPDHLSMAEVLRMRRLGATKVQIGYQSLSDRVLRANHRGHDVAATRRAMALLRQAGFKILAHWMPNLYASTPEEDVEDFRRIFDDRDFRPDELKIYPCSLISSAELMDYYHDGRWRPYSHGELLFVLTESLQATPPYCRVSRMIRDIPGTDIVDGNRLTNFRQLVEESLRQAGVSLREIRSREVRGRRVRRRDLRLECLEYESSHGRELFLQFVDAEQRLAAFMRLSLPDRSLPERKNPIQEIEGSAMIREVHVYGALVGIGLREREKLQHAGLGRSLIQEARRRAQQEGYADLAVISSVGTRPYYRRLGFEDGRLYQHLHLPPALPASSQS